MKKNHQLFCRWNFLFIFSPLSPLSLSLSHLFPYYHSPALSPISPHCQSLSPLSHSFASLPLSLSHYLSLGIYLSLSLSLLVIEKSIILSSLQCQSQNWSLKARPTFLRESFSAPAAESTTGLKNWPLMVAIKSICRFVNNCPNVEQILEENTVKLTELKRSIYFPRTSISRKSPIVNLPLRFSAQVVEYQSKDSMDPGSNPSSRWAHFFFLP